MNASGTVDSSFALDTIDMEAYFTILCPDMIKHMSEAGVKSFDDMGLEDAMELKKVFTEQLLPYIQKWREVIAGVGKKGKEAGDE